MLRMLPLFLGGVVVAVVLAGSAGASAAVAASPEQRPAAVNPVPSLTPVAARSGSGASWFGARVCPRCARPTASRCGPSSTRRPTGFASRLGSRRLRPPVRSTTSPCRRSRLTRRSCGPDQASRIRALGSAFHALAEINVTGWTSWVASTGSSWYAAGVEARRRMATAGYDVAAGDTWALNELSSAVQARRGQRTREHAGLPQRAARRRRRPARSPRRGLRRPESVRRPAISRSTRRGCRTGTRTLRSGAT